MLEALADVTERAGTGRPAGIARQPQVEAEEVTAG
jgi:hypothetical protein